MTRLFYRIENKTYLDKKAFISEAQENLLGLEDVYDIFDINTSTRAANLIQV